MCHPPAEEYCAWSQMLVKALSPCSAHALCSREYAIHSVCMLSYDGVEATREGCSTSVIQGTPHAACCGGCPSGLGQCVGLAYRTRKHLPGC